MSESSKIHAALIAVMREIPSIGKNSKNQQQGFNFRGIDSIYNELHGLLAKHGIVTLPLAGEPRTEERETKNGGVLRFTIIPMTYRFTAEDGSYVEARVIGEGMDSGDKSTNKASAIAHKYALLQTFLIPTEDMPDPDAESHEVKSKKEPAPKQEEAPKEPTKFNGPKHKELFQKLINEHYTQDDFMEAMKYKGKIPETASDFFKMTEKSAARFLEEYGYVVDDIIEHRAMKKP